MRRLAVLVLLAALAGGAAAQNGRPYESRVDIPERPSPPRLVNDFAGVLSPSEADAIERKLVAFSDSAGSQVAVVTVPTTDGVAPVDYATEILREWGVGRAGVDDGVVLLVAVADREVFIATGLGAEGPLPDATAATIVRNVIVPAFRQGDFYGGIDGATSAIVAALSGEFEGAQVSRRGGGGGGVPPVLCLLFVVFIVLVVLASRHAPPPSSGGGGAGPRRTRRRRGPGVIVIPSGGFGSGGGFGGGFGGGGFGGGGFGGFGGGFGGGGGAGGSW